MGYFIDEIVERFYLKRTFKGYVLMIKDKKYEPFVGDFTHFWRKANESEAQAFFSDINELNRDRETLDRIKKNNPELFI